MIAEGVLRSAGKGRLALDEPLEYERKPLPRKSAPRLAEDERSAQRAGQLLEYAARDGGVTVGEGANLTGCHSGFVEAELERLKATGGLAFHKGIYSAERAERTEEMQGAQQKGIKDFEQSASGMITLEKFLDAEARRDAAAFAKRSENYAADAEKRRMHEIAKEYLSDPEVARFTGRQAPLGLQKIEQEGLLGQSAEISAWRFAQLSDGALDILLPLRYSGAAAGDSGYKSLEGELLRHTVSSVKQLGEPRLEDYGGFLNIRISNPDEKYLADAIRKLMENPEALESANVSLSFSYSAAPRAARGEKRTTAAMQGTQHVADAQRSGAREKIIEYVTSSGSVSASMASELTGMKLVDAHDLLAAMARSGALRRDGNVYVLNGACLEDGSAAPGEESTAQGKRRHGWGKASEAVLKYLAGKGGPAKLSEIAEACGTPRATIYRLEGQGRIKKAGYGHYSL